MLSDIVKMKSHKKLDEDHIIKLFEFKNYKYNNYSTQGLNYVMLRNNKLFKSID